MTVMETQSQGGEGERQVQQQERTEGGEKVVVSSSSSLDPSKSLDSRSEGDGSKPEEVPTLPSSFEFEIWHPDEYLSSDDVIGIQPKAVAVDTKVSKGLLCYQTSNV